MYRLTAKQLAKATRTAGSNAENQLKRLEPYLGNTEGNSITLLIEFKAQFCKVFNLCSIKWSIRSDSVTESACIGLI